MIPPDSMRKLDALIESPADNTEKDSPIHNKDGLILYSKAKDDRNRMSELTEA